MYRVKLALFCAHQVQLGAILGLLIEKKFKQLWQVQFTAIILAEVTLVTLKVFSKTKIYLTV